MRLKGVPCYPCAGDSVGALNRNWGWGSRKGVPPPNDRHLFTSLTLLKIRTRCYKRVLDVNSLCVGVNIEQLKSIIIDAIQLLYANGRKGFYTCRSYTLKLI